ncbi:MAG: ribosome biogenesis GTPase Der [Planctomycetota bacterium]
MPIPRVAIVGRPNVGKSSLLNLIARERISIVDPTPGVTRDRVTVTVDLQHPTNDGPLKPIELTDTGGFGVYVAEGGRFDEVGADLASLTDDIEHQIAEAVSSADLILFAVDVQAGITPQDQEIARLLREQKLGSREKPDTLTPVMIVATKTDSQKWEPDAYELAALGFGEPILVSSKTNYMRRDMLDRLYESVPAWSPTAADPDESHTDLRIAIVGKRNAGKSTLVNALAGQPRVIVSEIAGTTRDAIDVRVELSEDVSEDLAGRSITLIDTAGLRRKKSFQDQIEWYAFDRAQRAIARADVILMLIDATTDISQVDEQLGQLVVESHKPVALVVNKWDLVRGRKNQKGQPISPPDYEKYVRKELKGLEFAPIAMMSASELLNVGEVLELAFELHDQASARIGTGELNRALKRILEKHHPASDNGKYGRVYFASQVKTNPPTLVLVVNRPELFNNTYQRYLMNRIREQFPFPEVPIRMVLRSRKRAEEAAVKAGRATREELRRRTFDVDPETGQFVDTMDWTSLLEDLPEDPAELFDD